MIHLCLHNFWHYNISLLKNIKINCPLNTLQIDVLRIKPTVLYDTNSVIRKHFSTDFTVQHKPSQAKLGELCPPPGRNTLGLDFTVLTHLCNSVPLYMYILALDITCCQLWFLRSNWQNSHKFLFKSVRPLNQSVHSI